MSERERERAREEEGQKYNNLKIHQHTGLVPCTCCKVEMCGFTDVVYTVSVSADSRERWRRSFFTFSTTSDNTAWAFKNKNHLVNESMKIQSGNLAFGRLINIWNE